VLRIADEVFNRLKNGEDPDSVRRSYRSQSQVSEGFRLYIDYQEKKMRETCPELAAAEEKLRQTTIMYDRKTQEKKELTEDVSSLRSEKAGLQKDVDEKRAEFKSLCKGVETLQKRGFNQSIMTRISESVDLNGPEVWRVLENTAERARLQEEIEICKRTKEEVECDVSLLNAKKQKAKNSLCSVERQLASAEAKLSVLGGIVDLFESCQKAGFTLEDMKALFSFLIQKEVGKNPCQSLAHLLEQIEAQKDLEATKSELRLAENRLSETLVLESQSKARVELVEKTCIKSLQEQEAAGLEYIHQYAGKINEWMSSVMVNFQSEIEKAKDCAVEVGVLRQEKIQLEKVIVQAKVLMGMLESDECLQRIEPMFVIQLLERFQLWLELKWPGAKVSIIQALTSFELRAVPYLYGMKMSSLMTASIQAIRERLSLEKKMETNSTKD
jgi:hypothetical protein